MTRVLSLGGSFFAFLAGSVISASVSLFIAAFGSPLLPTRWGTLILSSGLLAAGGAGWIYVALVLDDLERAANAMSDRSSLREELLRGAAGRLQWIAGGSGLVALGGLGLMAWDALT